MLSANKWVFDLEKARDVEFMVNTSGARVSATVGIKRELKLNTFIIWYRVVFLVEPEQFSLAKVSGGVGHYSLPRIGPKCGEWWRRN